MVPPVLHSPSPRPSPRWRGEGARRRHTPRPVYGEREGPSPQGWEGEGLFLYEFGPRSIDTGCQRFRSPFASTDGLTHDIGHRPVSASDNSRPTRRRRAGSNRAVAEATCAVRITLSILRSGLLPPGGSCSRTSSPAAAIIFSSSALISAASSVVGPRPVEI